MVFKSGTKLRKNHDPDLRSGSKITGKTDFLQQELSFQKKQSGMWGEIAKICLRVIQP
ncbi:hypothetical protein D9M70_585350 [compost metagenome]